MGPGSSNFFKAFVFPFEQQIVKCSCAPRPILSVAKLKEWQ